jgi:predicted nucleic acid-binding protein
VKYLLDTNLLSELLKRRPNAGVVRWVEETSVADMTVSVMTIGEIGRGIARLRPGDQRQRLQNWLDDWILPRFATRSLTLTVEDMLEWGRRFGQFERDGRPKAVIDSLLAVTAARHGLTVVTRNVWDFEEFDVPVINPWDDENGA